MKLTREDIFAYFLKLYRNDYLYGVAASLLLFLLLLPYSIQVEFMQNDDWVYYGLVERFMILDFTLDPLLAPTFYTQGILGMVFSWIFGIEYLPILTLIVSVLVFFVLYAILLKHFELSRFWSSVVSLLVFFNPLFIYSMWGFMTENYFLLFFLLAVWSYLNLLKSGSYRDMFGYGTFLFLALNIRQVAIAFPLSALIHSIIKRDKKLIILNAGVLAVLSIYYVLIFPATDEMREKSLQFQHLADTPYVYALVYGALVLMAALLLPLFIPSVGSINIKKLFIFVAVSAGAYVLLNRWFEPMKVSWGEFPYFENTFERTGFYPRGILGTKYYFKYFFDLYINWDLAAKVMLSLFLGAVTLRFKKINGLWGIFIVVYLSAMCVTETFYDRYLVVLIPFIIFFVLGINGLGKINKVAAIPFVAFLIFFSYQFSSDFILVNKYIWDKSEELVVSHDKEPKRIQGTNAWKLKYLNERRNYVFDFSYDSPMVNENYRDNYTIEEIKRIDFQGSLWVNPYIYLYKKVD